MSSWGLFKESLSLYVAEKAAPKQQHVCICLHGNFWQQSIFGPPPPDIRIIVQKYSLLSELEVETACLLAAVDVSLYFDCFLLTKMVATTQ